MFKTLFFIEQTGTSIYSFWYAFNCKWKILEKWRNLPELYVK